MQIFNPLRFTVLCFGFALACCAANVEKEVPIPNVVFISVDDLRPEIAALGATHMVMPHMDDLVNQGRAFTNHFVQVPSCGPSRYALLTGQVPKSLAYTFNNDVIKDDLRHLPMSYESFAHAIRDNGYETISIGKISHFPGGKIYSYTGEGDGSPEMPHSWDVNTAPTGAWKTEWNGFFGYANGASRTTLGKPNSPPVEAVEGDDHIYPDAFIADEAIHQLERLSQSNEPFLLAVGFYNPHLPFAAPKKYWDLYDQDDIELAKYPNPPLDYMDGPTTLHDNGEYNQYGVQPAKPTLTNPMPDDYARKVRHAYYASVSYVDAQIGRILSELERQGLADNTIVILWGDHGWHLGEQGIWGKHTLHDLSLRSPLIVKTPDMERPGVKSETIVETVDIYPTLLDLLDISLADRKLLAGTSLTPQLQNPDLDTGRVARGYFKKNVTLRSDSYRVIAFQGGRREDIQVFDLTADPDEVNDLNPNIPEAAQTLVDKTLVHLLADDPDVKIRDFDER